MLKDTNHPDYREGMVLEWNDEVRASSNFEKYVALVGKGPFKDFEVATVAHRSTVYGDERFRDGMKVPQKLVDEEAREDIALQVGDTQRVKLRVIDDEGHQVSAEFPGHFFSQAK